MHAFRLLFFCIVGSLFFPALHAKEKAKHAQGSGEWKHEELRRFTAAEARQGVAVDDNHFYAIDNHSIGKYRKDTGVRVSGWTGEKNEVIKHLNAGLVIQEVLYVAHSNYPDVPATSSVEFWQVDGMKPVGNQSFGLAPGSLTWVAKKKQDDDKGWYACFARYESDGGVGSAGTQIIRFDEQWRQTSAWVFPKELVAKFGKYSASGGAFGPEGMLFVTGHDAKELYVLQLPKMGAILEWVATIPISAEGQAFAFDPADRGLLYSISRKSREVIVSRITFKRE